MTDKRRSFFELFKAAKANIIMIQESHSTPDIEKFWRKEWNGEIFFSHGTSSSNGVATLIKDNTNFSITNEIKDKEGRYLIIEAKIGDQNIAICNLYAPNSDSPAFFSNLLTVIENLEAENFIMGGDWNVALNNNLDTFGTNIDRNPKAREVILSWMADNDIIDVFRCKYPDTKKYTYIRKRPFAHGRRLDYFLVSSPLLNIIEDVKIGTKIY